VLGVHGIADKILPRALGESARDFFVARNRCGKPVPDVASTHARVTAARKAGRTELRCVDYQGCKDAPVRWCVHSEGGYDDVNHGWPTDGGKVIWDFIAGRGVNACNAHDPGPCEADCAAGKAGACFTYGMAIAGYADAPVRLAADTRKAARVLARGCELGHLPSCRTKASVESDHGKPDRPACEQWADLCKRGDQESCSFAGICLLNDKREGQRALQLFRDGCERDDRVACRALGMRHLFGDLVQPNPYAAVPLLRKACALDDQLACAHLGDALEHGVGTTKDAATARLLYREACARGIKIVACQALTRLGETPPRIRER
jgi:hypothetical protein